MTAAQQNVTEAEAAVYNNNNKTGSKEFVQTAVRFDRQTKKLLESAAAARHTTQQALINAAVLKDLADETADENPDAASPAPAEVPSGGFQLDGRVNVSVPTSAGRVTILWNQPAEEQEQEDPAQGMTVGHPHRP